MMISPIQVYHVWLYLKGFFFLLWLKSCSNLFWLEFNLYVINTNWTFPSALQGKQYTIPTFRGKNSKSKQLYSLIKLMISSGTNTQCSWIVVLLRNANFFECTAVSAALFPSQYAKTQTAWSPCYVNV